MNELYLEILRTARGGVVLEIVLVSLFFLILGAGVFFLPFEIKTKTGTRRLFRMKEKKQMWVFKAVVWLLLLGGGLWFGLARGSVVSAINTDMAQGSIVTLSTEYAVETPFLPLKNRRTVWVYEGKESFPLTQYGVDTAPGVGIGQVVYGENSKIVLSLGND